MRHFYVHLLMGLFFSVACDSGKRHVTRSRAQTDIQSQSPSGESLTGGGNR